MFFQSIYTQEIAAEGPEAAEILTKDVARKAMQDARVKAIPACPEEMSEAIRLLEEGSLPDSIKDLYLDNVTWSQKQNAHGGTRVTKHFAVLLGDKQLFETVTSASTFTFADATFKITPRTARNVSVRGAQVQNRSNISFLANVTRLANMKMKDTYYTTLLFSVSHCKICRIQQFLKVLFKL